MKITLLCGGRVGWGQGFLSVKS